MTLDEWIIDKAARNLDEGQSSQTFSISHISANFETISGYYSQQLDTNQLSQLTDSIQSITVDFSGYGPGDFNDNDGGDGDIGDIFLSISPLSNVIDLSLVNNNEDEFVEFDTDGLNNASFWTNYRLLDTNNGDVGHLSIGDGLMNMMTNIMICDEQSSDSYINGYIHDNNVDLSEITPRLERIGLHGGNDGDWGDVSLEFSYDPDDGSIDIARIHGYGWGEEYQSEDGSGPLPEFRF